MNIYQYNENYLKNQILKEVNANDLQFILK
jgi:hypothetical protein